MDRGAAGRRRGRATAAGGGPALSAGATWVTGAAGFLGSHLVERLLARGRTVVGLDAFTPYYEPTVKRANLSRAIRDERFRLVEGDLAAFDLDALPAPETVYHLAAQAGVRASWGTEFETYVHHNLIATQRLLEHLRARPLRRLVFASSSSVYGDAERYPTSEADLPRPYSPYGVTKLAAEQLCLLYRRNFELPAVCLRFFTVYGPRQRPDMAFHRFCEAVLDERPIRVYGDGTQRRDFTFVDDALDALLLAGKKGRAGGVYNVGGGRSTELREVFRVLGRLVDCEPELAYGARVPGDAPHTGADLARARAELGYAPRVGLEQGLAAQLEWHRARRAVREGVQ